MIFLTQMSTWVIYRDGKMIGCVGLKGLGAREDDCPWVQTCSLTLYSVVKLIMVMVTQLTILKNVNL